MKVAIAIDSFKGSLSSLQAGEAAAAGVRRVFPGAEVAVRPLADGGEGTVDALVAGLGGTPVEVTVTGPAGRPTVARYGLLPGGVAVMEMAQAAGIDAYFPILRQVVTLEEALDAKTAAANLAATVEQAFRLLKGGVG